MVEWYRAGCGYWEIMEEVEGFVRELGKALGRKLEEPFRRLTYAAAFEAHAGQAPPSDPIEAQRVWINDVEPKLVVPTFVYDYPARDAAFASVRGDVAERFELYIAGVELGNAFTELLDAEELLERWKANNASRIEAGRSAHPIDSRVLDAVARHPRAGGVALGFDRLLLVLLGLSDIRETQITG